MKNLSTAPILTTKRLILRGPERDDLPEFTRFMTSAPSMEAQGETITTEQAWFGFLIGIGTTSASLRSLNSRRGIPSAE